MGFLCTSLLGCMGKQADSMIHSLFLFRLHLNPEPKALEAGYKPTLNENKDFSLRQEVEPLKVKGDL